ncbi:DUF1622 domain-containing protein [Methylophaga sp.]|uniref:DUF1622 domain-containing protein n=1 Tax=Methylophaga sp. TaxID=2024840 RepID=UPI0039B08A63
MLQLLKPSELRLLLCLLYALCNVVTRLLKKDDSDSIFQELRQLLGLGILLGLEFLISSDIIYTMEVELTF